MAEEYEKAVTKGKSRDDLTIFNDLNEDVFEDIILNIEHTTKRGKIAFSLADKCKTAKYPEGNFKLALVNLKKNFANM